MDIWQLRAERYKDENYPGVRKRMPRIADTTYKYPSVG